MSVVDDDLLSAVLRQRPDVVAATLDGETVVYQPERESLTVLDTMGTIIWTLLDGAVSLGDLCEELADAYRVPLTRVREDVLRLVLELRDADLLDRD